MKPTHTCGTARPAESAKLLYTEAAASWTLEPTHLCDVRHEASVHPSPHSIACSSFLGLEQAFPGQYVLLQVLLLREPGEQTTRPLDRQTIQAQVTGILLCVSDKHYRFTLKTLVLQRHNVLSHASRLSLERASCQVSATPGLHTWTK